ncbi:alpha/beta hydrolase [Arthrobacter livingstonensis]|uniref:Alpha/beta hydrolase n=1 Tax=Arthrobacter livingstonensis TaxID=670078 RepID=A0A2V5LP11_9MICC|nr:alpha/beta hydrolase [Arthrobacter livingstonensis]PYI69680.1 alpha/beta hydrolase [Arthrobacter livingstonensis]
MTPQRYAYGPDPSQWAELYLPEVPRHAGVVVVIHGGYWRSRYGADLGAPLARDLASHGVAAWNLEYRRMGNGGGWPETFLDVAAGIDALARAAGDHGLDLSRVVVLGHSAGGQLGVWAAGRADLPATAVGGAPAVEVSGVVSQSGLLNLTQAQHLGLSNNAVTALLGNDVALVDPMAAIPLPVPVYAVQAADDDDVPASQSQSYVNAVVAAGGQAEFIDVPGDHYDLINPASGAYAVCRDLVLGLLARA